MASLLVPGSRVLTSRAEAGLDTRPTSSVAELLGGKQDRGTLSLQFISLHPPL